MNSTNNNNYTKAPDSVRISLTEITQSNKTHSNLSILEKYSHEGFVKKEVNKKLKIAFYLLISFHLLIIVNEIIRCSLALYTMKFGNAYLDNFVKEKNYELTVREIIKDKILCTFFCIDKSIRVFIFNIFYIFVRSSKK